MSKQLMLDEFATVETPPNDPGRNDQPQDDDFDTHEWNRRIAHLTSAGAGMGAKIPPGKRQAFSADYVESVTPLYDEFGLSEALHDLGIIGGGVGEDAPAWVKLAASAGASVVIALTLKGQYGGGGAIPASDGASDNDGANAKAGEQQFYEESDYDAYTG